MPRDTTDLPAALPHPAASMHRRGAFLQAGSLFALAAVFGVFALEAPGFLTIGNLANVVSQVAVIGVLALGLTIVIAGAGPTS